MAVGRGILVKKLLTSNPSPQTARFDPSPGQANLGLNQFDCWHQTQVGPGLPRLRQEWHDPARAQAKPGQQAVDQVWVVLRPKQARTRH